MKSIVLAAIRFYQRNVSPGMRPTCRFGPTCSQYAYESVEAYGAVRGSLMSIWRILRCNPLNDGGYDPVPKKPVSMSASQRVSASGRDSTS